MDKKVDALLRDIYALDGSLKAQDEAVRKLVSTLIASRPDVVPDSAFVARLREEVLSAHASHPAARSRAVKDLTRGQSDWLWWAIRIAPIGAVAVLTLVLAQPPSPYLESPRDMGSEESGMESVPASAPAADSVAPSPTMKMAAPAGDDSVGAEMNTIMAPEEDASLYATQAITERTVPTVGNSVEVFGQVSGHAIEASFVTLDVPGYVRVYTYVDDKPAEFLGMSAELPPGSHEGVMVPLNRKAGKGEALYAQLFLSDGDGVFNPSRDLPLHDAEYGFAYTIFVVN